MFTKTELLLGKENLTKIINSNICVVGIGGVGGFVVEILSRTGIGNLTLIDFDIIEPSNINRQIMSLNSTIGQNKAEVMGKRVKDINPNCNVKVFNKKLSANNVDKLLSNQNFDYVIDCIDIVTDKVDLIKYCKNKKIKIISALGTGNRSCLPHYIVEDIYRTKNDGLAKILRKKLRELNIDNLPVAFCVEIPDKKFQNPASLIWHPMVCASVLSAFVVNELIKK